MECTDYDLRYLRTCYRIVGAEYELSVYQLSREDSEKLGCFYVLGQIGRHIQIREAHGSRLDHADSERCHDHLGRFCPCDGVIGPKCAVRSRDHPMGQCYGCIRSIPIARGDIIEWQIQFLSAHSLPSSRIYEYLQKFGTGEVIVWTIEHRVVHDTAYGETDYIK